MDDYEKIPEEAGPQIEDAQPKEKRRAINLSEEDKNQIRKINEGIEGIPKEIVETSFEKIVETLQNGHSLNRLIRDKEGVVHAYMSCLDEEKEGRKGVYICFLASDGEISIQLKEEINKLLERANKFEYSYISFSSENKALVRLMRTFGFKEINEYHQGLGKLYRKEILGKEGKTKVEVQEAIDYLTSQAKELMESLTPEEETSLRESLAKAIERKIDLKLYNLYGSIYTLKEARVSITNLSISQIHKEAKKIQSDKERERKPKEYAKVLKELLNLNEKQEKDILDILKDNKTPKYDELLKKYFQEQKVIYDDTITYDRIYLNSLVEKDPENLGTYNIDEKQITLLSLKTMDHLKKETEKMGHCIGESDFYINKIIKGEIMAISLRDSNDEPLYTIEYDIKTRTIKQFKGGNDTPVNSLPNTRKLVLDTLNAFIKANLQVDRFSEGVGYCIYRDEDGVFHDLDNDKLTLDFFRQNRESTFIKGFLRIEEGVTKEELKTIAESGIDIDVTDLSNDLKDTLTMVRGSLVDKSVSKLTFKNLKEVGGYLDLNYLTSAEGLTLPKNVGGDLNLSSLTSAEGLTLPKNVGGNLNLNNLTSAEGLTLPKNVGGYLNLNYLTSAEGLTLPKNVGGNLNLNNLTSAEGLTLPKNVGGYLNLRSLTSAEGLTLPKNVGGDLNLRSLTSAEGLTLPENVGGDLYLNNLTSAEGLTLPKNVGGDLSLSSLTSAEGLTLPKNVGGDLNLSSLTSAEGLTLPENVGGDLDLNYLTSAEGLTLPKNVGGDLNLRSLTSAEGLVLPIGFKNKFYYRELPESEVTELKNKYPKVTFIKI